MRHACALLALCVSLLASALRADAAPQLVIYRCTDAAGNVTLQNGTRCPKGHKQETRRVETPKPPEPAVLAPAPAATPVMPAPTPAAANHHDTRGNNAPGILPPPPLYRCHAHSGNSYLSEDGAPKDRCVALQVSDLSGSQGRSGAQACEVQQDRCERIPDEELCAAWSQHDKQAESLVALDNPDIAAKANALHARTRKVMTATSCAQNP